MIILRLFFSLFIAWLLGYLIVYLFDPQKKIPWFEGAALSFLLGQGVLTLLLFLLLFLPVANRSIVLTGLILVFFGAKLFFDKNKVWVKSSFQFNKKGLSLFLVLLLFASLTLKVSYSFIETCSKPEYSWDASANWTEAGRNYFHADKFSNKGVIGEMKKSVTSYPRALSLMHYWIFSWLGEDNDQWSKIIFPLDLLCLLIIFYYALKPSRGGLGALAFTYLLCSAPLFLYHSTIGYADLTKTVYFSVGIIYFYRWLQTKQKNYFWFFGLCLALTTWVKLEGKMLFAIGFALLLSYLWLGYRASLRAKLFYVGQYISLFLIIGLPWQLFSLFNHLPDPQTKLSLSLSLFFEFHQKMYDLMFMEGSWGLFWVIFVAGLLFFFKRQLTGENRYLFLATILFYGNLLFIYLFFPSAVAEMMATFNRVLLPFYPVAVFNLGVILPVFESKSGVKI